jgi:O-acetylhomoserine (thiol)-lyase
VETLACHPASTTHSELSPEELATNGITPGLVRVSVGVEHHLDLYQDFKHALDVL